MGARVDRRPAEVHPDGAGRRRQLDERFRSRCQRAASILRSVSSRGRAARTDPELGAALAPGQGLPHRAEMPADRLQLADDRLARRPRSSPSAEAARSSRNRSSVSRSSGKGHARRLEDRPRERRAASFRSRAPRSAGTTATGTPSRAASSSSGSSAITSTASERMRREIEVDVVLRDPELLEVGAHRLRRDPLVAQRGDRCRPRRASRASCRRGRARGRSGCTRGASAPSATCERAVQRLVRPVVVAADHVRDPEVDVVDDAREVVGGGAVVAEQRHALEALAAARRRLRGSARAGRSGAPGPSSQRDPEPAQVVEDRLLAAGQVPGRDRCRRSAAASCRRSCGWQPHRARCRCGGIRSGSERSEPSRVLA